MVKNTFHHVLLASHGTAGAIAAEGMATSTCAQGGMIYHLIVVPTFWQGMTGDDWLNNGSTRDHFCHYLETELGKEVDAHCERVRKKAEANALHYKKMIIFGEPDKSLIQYSKTELFDLVVIGSTRPKEKKGLRSRMLTHDLARMLDVPLLIVPYPQKL